MATTRTTNVCNSSKRTSQRTYAATTTKITTNNYCLCINRGFPNCRKQSTSMTGWSPIHRRAAAPTNTLSLPSTLGTVLTTANSSVASSVIRTVRCFIAIPPKTNSTPKHWTPPGKDKSSTIHAVIYWSIHRWATTEAASKTLVSLFTMRQRVA